MTDDSRTPPRPQPQPQPQQDSHSENQRGQTSSTNHNRKQTHLHSTTTHKSQLMTSKQPSDQDIQWVYDFWNVFSSTILDSNKRKGILRACLNIDAPYVTTTAFAEEVRSQLEEYGLLADQSTFDRNHLTNHLDPFERLGILYRIPKFNTTGEYLIRPSGALVNWLDDCSLRRQLLPDDLPGADHWGAVYFGQYITHTLPSEDEGLTPTQDEFDPTITAGSTLPHRAHLYRTVNEYAQLNREPEPEPEPDGQETPAPRIQFAMGSLKTVRNSDSLDSSPSQIADHLELETDIPQPDEGWQQDVRNSRKQKHDYAIFGQISHPQVTEWTNQTQLCRKLRTQLRSWLAMAEQQYRHDIPPTEKPQIEKFHQTTEEIHTRNPRNHPLERFGYDVTIRSSGDDRGGGICFGLYRRTG